MYNDSDTQRLCLTPSTPAPVHVPTRSPVLPVLSYHHIMIRWCVVDTLTSRHIPWRQVTLSQDTLMSRRWSYRRIVMRWYVCLFGVVWSIHLAFTASFTATWSANIHDQLISICLIRLTFDALRVACASKLSSNIWLWCGRMVRKVSMSWE